MSIFDNSPADKRTLIAIVLSVVVITVSMIVQGALFPPPEQPAPPAQAATQAPAPVAATTAPAVPSGPVPSALIKPAQAPAAAQPGATAATAATTVPGSAMTPLAEMRYTIKTDLLEAVFTNRGGDLVSLKLRQHKDKDGAVDLIVPNAGGSKGLAISFGGAKAAPIRDLFATTLMSDDRSIEFSQKFSAVVPGKPAPQDFVLKKKFSFRDGEYMFGMTVTLENSVNDYLPLNEDGYAYTVSLGPQIGPSLDAHQKSANSDYRKFISFVEGKKKEESVKADVPASPKGQPTWVAISGKYFTFIAAPELTEFKPVFSTGPDPKIVQTDAMTISRPMIRASRQVDSFYFYFGPKTSAELAKYDYADRNGFKRGDLRLENAMDNSNILGWLESILKFCLNIFYRLIPNYGVAIILVTLLVKILFFPLTKKGSEGAARMQELQPKMAELQAKYKGNPQKLNQEMAAFYKREGYNPMSGCLPLLIQFPLFIAMYNLFNNHFDLRGAMFIPTWIPDLSQPEAILTFDPINLVVWQISAIRVLPVIYLLSQLFYGKFTQAATPSQSATQMKIMMYGMPIFFFFILYDVPSGLLIYWIATNILSIVQQVAINDWLKKRKAALADGDAAPKVAPAKPGSKKIAPNKKE